MSKKLIKFNNKEYEIDESDFASAKAEIENHLLSVMNGSGSIIKLGGSSYNIDSTKLTNATNDFTSHLGTISGNGEKIVVNNVEYSIDSAKLSDAVAEIESILGSLNSEEESFGFPIAWNSKDVMGNVSVLAGNQQFVKISDFIPTIDDFTGAGVTEKGDGYEEFYSCTYCDSIDSIRECFIADYGEGMMQMISVATAGEYSGVTFPETGLYVLDIGSIWDENVDFVVKQVSTLATPEISLTGQILTITPVENATEYEIYVSKYDNYVEDELVYTTTKTTIDLSEQLLPLTNDSYIFVRAISSDGYKPSESVIVYTLPTLATPEISLTGQILTITPVENATEYEIYVGDELVYTTTETIVDLLSALNNDGGYYVKVRAISPGIYFASNFISTWYLILTGDYVVFSSPNTFTLKVVDNQKYWDGTLEYSTDKNTWNEWSGTNTINSSTDGKLYMRGIGNTCITGSSAGYYNARWVFTGNTTYCNGNIENLLDYQTVANGEHPVMADSCYSGMFRGSNLTTAPELPATTLADSCYDDMFRDTNLTTPPELPATTLANSCYSGMFYACTNLTTAPALPATTLTNSCYSAMFGACKNLTTAPELPATTLADSCYNGMFQNTSLTTAPTLPATTLANSCYKNMFFHCLNLTTPPELPATTLADSCYSGMFNDCTNLTTAPALPATTLADSCYSIMFDTCTSLTTPPELPATTLADYCYSHMFDGCTNLTTIPALPATTLAKNCYSGMFEGCTNLTTIPALPATTLTKNCYYYMFCNCKNIKLSTTHTDEYQNAYRIPTSGTGTTDEYALDYMFGNTGGTFKPTPEINTTYYTSNEII